MPQLQKNQLYTVTVTGYTAEGLGVARLDGQVIFVHGGVRGETRPAAGAAGTEGEAAAEPEAAERKSPS